ncbi:LCP family protein [Luteococcus sp. Sow4_B9]|uniref:LCP family protein n=1 Tax=Luteococcus sp. Sow4_B9 TaxID=3438792 RepID=UPI003F953527
MAEARRAGQQRDDAPGTPRYADPDSVVDAPVVPRRTVVTWDEESPDDWRDEGTPPWHRSDGEKPGARATGRTSPAAAQHRSAFRDGREHSFRSSLGWTALGALFPGLGLWPTRRRAIGLAVLGAMVLTLLTLILVTLWRPAAVAAVAVKPGMLRLVGIGAILGAMVLSGLVTLTHMTTRPHSVTPLQRTIGTATVGLLTFMISAPLIVGASYTRSQASLVNNVFKNATRSLTRPDLGTGDVWKNKPRLNILLLGSDSTAARTEHGDGVRTDTIMVASINTSNGDTTLLQIPRNMARMPFPDGSPLHELYPDGFYSETADNPDYFANAIYGNVPALHPELFTATDYPGADALKVGVGAALGLDIDYFAMINIDGLTRLIDAMGGVRLNVNSRIPVAGDSEGRAATGWIEPGEEKLLNGYYAMWYARSRKGSTDYNRMGRQTCVVKAVIDQADPATLLTRYEGIASASQEMLVTDIPQDVLSPLVNLALRVKDGHIRRVLFVHQKDGFDTTDPDFEMMRAKVAAAIQETQDEPSTEPSSPPDPAGQPAAPASSAAPAPETTQPTQAPSEAPGTPSATPTVQSENVADACAYNPEPVDGQPQTDQPG